MGMRSDGVHVFGVLHRSAKGEPLLTTVESTGYSIATVDGGQLLTFSNAEGMVVEQFQPGTWEGVMDAIPGVDAHVVEE